MTFHFDPATKSQLSYIEILRNDLGLSIQRRDAHIRAIVERDVKPDQLSKAEASLVINKFKEWKDDLKS